MTSFGHWLAEQYRQPQLRALRDSMVERRQKVIDSVFHSVRIFYGPIGPHCLFQYESCGWHPWMARPVESMSIEVLIDESAYYEFHQTWLRAGYYRRLIFLRHWPFINEDYINEINDRLLPFFGERRHVPTRMKSCRFSAWSGKSATDVCSCKDDWFSVDTTLPHSEPGYVCLNECIVHSDTSSIAYRPHIGYRTDTDKPLVDPPPDVTAKEKQPTIWRDRPQKAFLRLAR